MTSKIDSFPNVKFKTLLTYLPVKECTQVGLVKDITGSPRPKTFCLYVTHVLRSQEFLFQLHCTLLLHVCKVSWGWHFPHGWEPHRTCPLYHGPLFHASQLWFIGTSMCAITILLKTLQQKAKDPKLWKQGPPCNLYEKTSLHFPLWKWNSHLLWFWDEKLLWRSKQALSTSPPHTVRL